jgi:hypothetical protein
MQVKFIGESQLQVLVMREHAFLFWALPLAHTGLIAQVEFSPAIAVVTGCSGRCIKQDWHRSLNQFRAMTV